VPTERVKEAVAVLASRRRTREIEADIRQLGQRLDEISPVPLSND
jgi:5-methylcytosine-specific restriction endonuclease McrBC regulatory subunit McrC